MRQATEDAELPRFLAFDYEAAVIKISCLLIAQSALCLDLAFGFYLTTAFIGQVKLAIRRR